MVVCYGVPSLSLFRLENARPSDNQALFLPFRTQQVCNVIVRFPNSLGCELGERRVYTRGIELRRPIVKTFFIESGHQDTELISSTQELSIFIEKTHASSLVAAVELLFSLRPICHFLTPNLPLLLLAFFQLDFFPIHVSYLFPLSD